MFRTISVIGGDLRQLAAAQFMRKDGFDIILYGFEGTDKHGIRDTSDVSGALCADAVILPVPVSFDGKYVNMPFSKNKLSTDELVANLNPAAMVFGGQIKPELAEALEQRGIKYCDYLKREELAIRNAVPTAEGAIELAISETPITLHGSRCLVTGYGRIGKILSKMLCGLGAHVSVEARKYADLAMIEGHGCNALSLKELGHHVNEFDIIFNTVPALIFDAELLKKIRRNTLIIDLASRPGGVDFILHRLIIP
ncbi:MAG: dipicolinate synthase subunit DpsA [bacterium]|nr:dipicolinate synthase subunit DpsA [bacterium]